MNIDETAQKIVSSFNAENNVMLKEETKEMLRQINYNEGMFSVVKRPYLVAKSLYFMLTEDFLSEENQVSIIKLAYFCLLNNYLKNMDSKPGDSEYDWPGIELRPWQWKHQFLTTGLPENSH